MYTKKTSPYSQKQDISQYPQNHSKTRQSPRNVQQHRAHRGGDRVYMPASNTGVIPSGSKQQSTGQISKGKHTYYNADNKLVAAVAPTTFPQLHGTESRHQYGKQSTDGNDAASGTLPQLKTSDHVPHSSSHAHSHTSHGGGSLASSYAGGQASERTKRDQHGNRIPMTAAEALKLYRSKLSAFEQTEILDFPEIYFLGLEAKKIEGVPGGAQNNGYDDENGSYIKVMNDHLSYRFEILDILGRGSFGQVVMCRDHKTDNDVAIKILKNRPRAEQAQELRGSITVLHDHLVYRYEVLEVLGKGSFGQVVKCYDHKTDQMVAVKIIRNKKRFHHQALVEVKILDALRRKDNDNQHKIIHMIEYFYFRNHLCITFELMGGSVLLSPDGFAFSLLQCLKVLHREKIIHCDLKPENILLRQRGQSSIKVIDFGSSCYEHQRVYTYIQSRFYRSPEVILGLPYSMPIDMWSFGCILAELYTGYPLFPGENEVEQLACIMEVMGIPPTPLMDQATRKRLFFDSKGNPRCIINSKGKKRRQASKELPQAVKTSDAHFLDFIRRCLEWDPNHRLTPEEALQHDWIKEALVPRKDRAIRVHHKRTSASPSSSDNHSHHHSHQHHSTHHHSHHTTDPYKVPAQPPIREQTKEDWKLNFKDHRSAKTAQRVPPVGASADQSVEETSARVPSAKSNKTHRKPPTDDVIEEKVEKLNVGAVETIKLNFQSHLQHQENSDDKFLPPIAK